jgi:sugar phosphate isomerase/epimerase
MKTIQRRKFLKGAAVLPIGLTISHLNAKKAVAETFSISGDLKAKIKLSVNAWSYYVPLYKHINGETGGMSLFDMLEEAARLDLDAVDPTGYFFPGYPEVPDTSFINKFKKQAFLLGLDISGTGIRNDFANPDKEIRMADIKLARKWIEAASEMGAPVLRVFAGPQPDGHTWEETSEWMAEALSICAYHGSRNGVVIGVQNHGDMLKSADEVLKILDMVGSEWLGTIVDTGFFLTEDPYEDIERVIPYAVNWQVKKLLSDRKGPEINMKKLVKIIKGSEYRGYVPVETLPTPGKEDEYDAVAEVPVLLQKLRNAL